jgi:hypothetical protein
VVKVPRLAKGATPRRALTQLAAAKATGRLHVAGLPGGAVYLVDGLVDYAESAAATGVDRLLVGSQRVDAETWRTAMLDGAGPHRVGPLLVERGHLTAGELELATLGTINDAMYFVLTSEPAEVRFESRTRHWWGADPAVDPGVLLDQVDGQRRALDAAHPSAASDTTPVRPVRRVNLDRILLSGVQWEIALHADGRRCPAELARLLGRSGYAVILEIRRLAAAGLLVSTPAAAVAPVETTKIGRAAVPRQKSGQEPAAADRPSAVPTPEPEPAVADLPRRQPGAFLFEELQTDPQPFRPDQRRRLANGVNSIAGYCASSDEAPDENLLTRIRTALQALR